MLEAARVCAEYSLRELSRQPPGAPLPPPLTALQQCVAAAATVVRDGPSLQAAVQEGSCTAVQSIVDEFVGDGDSEVKDGVADQLGAWLDSTALPYLCDMLPDVPQPVHEEPCPATASARHAAHPDLVTPVCVWPRTAGPWSSSQPVQGSTGRLAAALRTAAFRCLGRRLLPRTFDAIKGWPECMATLQALRTCVQQVPSLRKAIAREVEGCFQARLLRLAVPTPTVLDVYSMALKALQHVDPSGIVADTATACIQRHLRGRADTVQCIVTALTASSSTPGLDDSALSAESAPGEAAAELRRALQAAAPKTSGALPGALTREDAAFTRPGGQAGPLPAPLTRKGPGVLALSLPATGWEARWLREALAQAAPALHAGLWQPDSRDHLTDGVRASASGDLMATLIALYGSPEVFATEFRSQLRKRVLSAHGYDVEAEVGTLELLKVRFGGAVMHEAEVMLMDIAESKRSTATVQEAEQALQPSDTLPHFGPKLLSEHYWPALRRGPTVVDEAGQPVQAPDDDHSVPPPAPRLHPSLAVHVQAYTKAYERLKAPRHLRWQHHLGRMRLRVTPAGHSEPLTVQASPLEASVLMFAGEQEQGMEVGAIASSMALQAATVAKLAGVWLRAGVLVLDGAGEGGTLRPARAHDAAPAAAAAAGEEDEDELDAETMQHMSVCEQFVEGMLRNMGTLPLASIHNNLKMFLSMDSSACTCRGEAPCSLSIACLAPGTPHTPLHRPILPGRIAGIPA